MERVRLDKTNTAHTDYIQYTDTPKKKKKITTTNHGGLIASTVTVTLILFSQI